MKIPKKLKVGGHTYTITFNKTNDEVRGKNNWGITNHELKTMYIDKEVPQSQKEETFIHELLHIVNHQTKLNYELSSHKEENIVKRMAESLYTILKDNNLLK